MGIKGVEIIDIIIQKRYYMFIRSIYANILKKHVAKLIQGKENKLWQR